MIKNKQLYCIILVSIFLHFVSAQNVIRVKANQPIASIQPNMWGIFFEDINMAADGGVYAELVKNRSFEFNDPLMGWNEEKIGNASGSLLVINRGDKYTKNPRFIRIETHSQQGSYGLSNEGFRGMGIKKNGGYDFSIWASVHNLSGIVIRVALVNQNGNTIGSASLKTTGIDWKKYQVHFKSDSTEMNAHLNVWFEGDGIIDVDMISLFPQDTWKQRPGGLRADLVQLLYELHPGFLRFPGGCIVEGRDLANRYQWKKTVGNIEDRQLIINRWNTEFAHRSTPDYFQSYGLGFFEYFQLAEDLGASPLPILNCGMACQFNTAEVVPTEQIDPYVQDALDLIEFANGSTESKWGNLRSKMGHPAPFQLKMLGVGNEQWGPQYIERYRIFRTAIHNKYPQIKLINSVGPFSGGDMFTFLNDTLRKMHADFLDEHYYSSPEWFLKNANRYDHYDRNGPKIFAGEYAAHTRLTDSAILKNNWQSALAEAAFMTGLERNADVVQMASYAPLFAHVQAWQWAPDLIWFNNLHAYGTPNYYVQKLYANNKGTNVVPIENNNEIIAGKDSLYATACIDTNSNELIIKLVNTAGKIQENTLIIETGKKKMVQAILTLLKANDLTAVNSFIQPENISPSTASLTWKGKEVLFTAAPYSLSVIRIKLQ